MPGFVYVGRRILYVIILFIKKDGDGFDYRSVEWIDERAGLGLQKACDGRTRQWTLVVNGVEAWNVSNIGGLSCLLHRE